MQRQRRMPEITESRFGDIINHTSGWIAGVGGQYGAKIADIMWLRSGGYKEVTCFKESKHSRSPFLLPELW